MKEWFKGTFILILSGALGMLLIVIAQLWESRIRREPQPLLNPSVLNEVAIAFLVAFIIGMSIDLSARNRDKQAHEKRLKEIQENVFRYLFGLTIPKTILEELTTTIFAAKFMREQLALTYEFRAVPTGFVLEQDGEKLFDKDLVKVGLTVSYVMRNMSHSSEAITIDHYFENVLQCEHSHSLFTDVILDTGEGPHHLRGEDLIRGNYISNDGIRCVLTVSTLLAHPDKPLMVHPDRPLKVEYRYETIRRRRDGELWVCTLPADGLSLEAVIVDPQLKLQFCPDTSHRLPPAIPFGSELTASAHRQWKIEGGVLPYQGVVLFWRPDLSQPGEPQASTCGLASGAEGEPDSAPPVL